MLLTFVEGDQIEVAGTDRVPLPESAISVFAEPSGQLREFTRVKLDSARAFARLHEIELTGDTIKLRNDADLTVESPRNDSEYGYGVIVQHPCSERDCLVTSVGPRGIDQVVTAISSMAFDAIDETLIVAALGDYRPATQRPPEVAMVFPGVGMLVSRRIAPSADRNLGRATGYQVAGGFLYRVGEGAGEYLVLDGGNVLTKLLPDPELEDVQGALEEVAKLTIEPVE